MRIELSNRQSDTVDAAGWNYGGNAAAIRQPRVEDGLRFRNIVAQASCYVFDSHDERFGRQFHTRNGLNVSGLFNEDPLGAVHHDFADIRVQDEMLDRTKKRENQLESVH